MTALTMDVRELSFDEIDLVAGGWRRSIVQWVYRMLRDGVAFEVVKAAADAMMELDIEPGGQDPYTLAKIGTIPD